MKLFKTNEFIVLLISLLLTLAAYFSLSYQQKEIERIKFEKDAKQIVTLVHNRMDAYKQVLMGGAALFQVKDAITREDWKQFVISQNIEITFPGIQGIGYSIALLPNEQQALIEKIHSEGYKEFDIYPHGDRTLYTSIIYLEPFDSRNRRAFGYDMFSEETRHEAMQRAMLSGTAATSGKVKLLQENNIDEQAGFLTYVPVYKKGFPLHTAKDREVAIKGFVYAPFRAKNFMNGISDQNHGNLRIEVFDDGKMNEDSLLFDSIPAMKATPRFMYTSKVNVQGHDWYLRFSDYQELQYSQLLYLILVGGVSFSFLLFFYLKMLIRQKNELNLLVSKLDASEQKYRAISEASIVPFFVVQKGVVVYGNQAQANALGYDSPDEIIGKVKLEQIIAPREWPRVYDMVQKRISGEHKELSYETVLVRKDGSEIFVQSFGVGGIYEGEPAVIGLFIDKTTEKKLEEERKHQQQILLQESTRKTLALKAGTVGIWEWKYDTNSLIWDDVMYQIYGFSETQFENPYTMWSNAVDPDDKPLVEANLFNAKENNQEYNIKFWITTPDGKRKYVHAIGINEFNEEGIPYGMVGINTDITESKNFELQLQNMAHYDQLTQLPNRIVLVDRLQQAMQQTSRNQQKIAVAYMDLDGFKEVNDTFGHAAGDSLLIEASRRMQSVLREGDTIARLGGDEFVAILVNQNSEMESLDVLKRVLDVISAPIYIADNEVIVSISIGVTFYPQKGDVGIDILLRQADQAMYHAKQSGKNQIVFFDNL